MEERVAKRGAKGNFDRLATIYDGLSTLVFGSMLDLAKTRFLSHIPRTARIIMPGAGTAKEMQILANLGFQGTLLLFETSAKMLQLAEKRYKRLVNPGFQIEYHLLPTNETPAYPPAEVILTHFFLDLFEAESLQAQLRALNHALIPGGQWLWADFWLPERSRPLLPQLLVSFMYGFFRLICGIEARKLPDMDNCFKQMGYRCHMRDQWGRGMIRAAIWEKPLSVSPDLVHP